MAMAGDEELRKQLAVVHRGVNLDEFSWNQLVPQLHKCANHLQAQLRRQFQRHFQDRLQIREGRWRVGGWGRHEGVSQRERISLRGGRFAAIIPGDSVAETVITSGIFNFLSIYNTLLVARLILTWFPDPPQVIANPLSTICDPYLNIFRGIIPPLGTIDLSPILAFLALNVFSSTAAALPAELPSNGAAAAAQSHLPHSRLTWRQRAQMKKGQMKNVRSLENKANDE